MKADNLLDAIGLLDDRHFECDKKQTATVTYSAPSKRGFYILIAAIIMSLALGVAAMAASPEFRELVFSFFHISQKQEIPENTVDSELSVDDMFVEQKITIADILEGKYVHTPVATQAESGVFLVCTDEIETKQGSHYDAYYENNSEFIKLEEYRFSQDYYLHGTAFHVEFDWAEYNNTAIITWVEANESFRMPGFSGDPSAALFQFVFISTNDNGDYIETYYPVLLNLRTGKLTDVLSGTGVDKLSRIANSAISEDRTKMLLSQATADGSVLYYVDITTKQMYSLDDLSGKHADSCSLIGNKLACWSLNNGYYQAWTIDLNTFNIIDLFTAERNALSTEEDDSGIIFLSGFDGWIHDGNMYSGSSFALKVDEAQNVYVIDLTTGAEIPIEGYKWTHGTQQIPSPDGTKLLLAGGPDGQDFEYIGVLDFENMTFVEFSRDNLNNVHEFLAYWFDDNTVLISSGSTPPYLCRDYYLYTLLTNEK